MTQALMVIALFHLGLWTTLGVLVRLEPPHRQATLTLVTGGGTGPVDGRTTETPHDTAA